MRSVVVVPSRALVLLVYDEELQLNSLLHSLSLSVVHPTTPPAPLSFFLLDLLVVERRRR